jgi:PAS domain S-box-containing protein
MLDQKKSDDVLGLLMQVGAAHLLDASTAAIYLTDDRGRITYYNEAAAALWGHRPILGTSEWCGSWKLRYPDGRPMPHDECPMAIAIKENRALQGEAMAERPDGTLIPFLAFPSPVRDRSGVTIGAINIMTDITERRKAEEATYRLAAIVESSDDAIVSKTLCGVVTSWNLGAQRLFGYSAEEAIGKHISFLIPTDRKDEEELILTRIRSGERIDHFDTIRQRKDGTLVHVSLTVSPVKNSDGTIIGASKIARDVSDRKESENRIRMLMREVNHRVKNQFAVILSMVRETNKRASTTDEFEEQVRERIMALARSHDLLVEGDWRGATLAHLILNQLEPFADHDRCEVIGEDLTLSAAAVQYLGIAFHELATNSIKYGALSNPRGVIAVEWSRTGDDRSRLRLTWKESGGPAVKEPSRRGFGRVVLERVAPASVDGVGHVSYDPSGITWTLDAPLSALTETKID